MESLDEDARLMLRYRDGDADAFSALYARHKGPLYRYLLRQVRNAGAAADLFQEVWSRLVATRSRYEARAKFATYLVSHSAQLHHGFFPARFAPAHRCGERTPTHDGQSSEPEVPEYQRPDGIAEFAEQQSALLAALSALPREQREAFLLHEETGLTIEEIARVTQVGIETAKSRLRYAIRKLKKSLASRAAHGDDAASIAQGYEGTRSMHPPDDLDEYLRGDSALSCQYRRESAPTPPPALDRRVLALSRPPGSSDTPAARRAAPYLAPLAFAASVLLSVALVLAIVFGPQRPKRADDAPRVVRVAAHADLSPNSPLNRRLRLYSSDPQARRARRARGSPTSRRCAARDAIAKRMRNFAAFAAPTPAIRTGDAARSAAHKRHRRRGDFG